MLLDLLLKYLRDVEAPIQKLAGAYVERYEEEIVAANRANLRIRVRFPNGHLLELNESIIGEAGRLTHIAFRHLSGIAAFHKIVTRFYSIYPKKVGKQLTSLKEIILWKEKNCLLPTMIM